MQKLIFKYVILQTLQIENMVFRKTFYCFLKGKLIDLICNFEYLCQFCWHENDWCRGQNCCLHVTFTFLWSLIRVYAQLQCNPAGAGKSAENSIHFRNTYTLRIYYKDCSGISKNIFVNIDKLCYSQFTFRIIFCFCIAINVKSMFTIRVVETLLE